MARAAMAGALHDVGAAVPVRAVVGVVPVRAWTEEQLPPDEEGWPNVEGEFHRARCAWRKHRIEREQIVFDREHVLARHLRIGGVWHHRVEVFAVPTDAVMKGTVKIVVAPPAD